MPEPQETQGLRTAHASYVNLDPSDYEYVDSYDFWDDRPGQFMGDPSDYDMGDGPSARTVTANNYHHATYLWLTRLLRESPSSKWDETGQCDHCGARMRYTVVMLHKPTGDHIAIGETCHNERFSYSDKVSKDVDRLRKQAAAGRMRQQVRAKHDAWLAADPRNMQAEDYLVLMHETGSTSDFYRDLLRKLNQYGDLSERQVAAVLKGIVRDAQRAAKQAEEAANPKPVVPVPEGRQVVEGTVISAKYQEGYYGDTFKMLVEDDRGFRVWGSVPNSIQAGNGEWVDVLDGDGKLVDRYYESRGGISSESRGARVRFTATLEQSADDPGFGFYKRPTKAEVLAGPPENNETGPEYGPPVPNPAAMAWQELNRNVAAAMRDVINAKDRGELSRSEMVDALTVLADMSNEGAPK